MARWRNSELETLFGGPLDDVGLTCETINELVLSGTASESELLDFKGKDLYAASVPINGRWSKEQEFSKDVAAFANLRGGVLLVGVDETGGVASASVPVVVARPELEERRLRMALVNYLAPLAEVYFVWTPANERDEWYLAVVVPPSARQPHGVLGARGDKRTSLRYPVRSGRDTRWMPEPEVAERYRRRVSAQLDHHDRVREVVSEAWTALEEQTDDLWLYVACVPESPAPGRIDRAALDDIERWHSTERDQSPLGRMVDAHGRGIPRRGRVTFTAATDAEHRDPTEIRSGYVELYVDGSAFVAVPASYDKNAVSGGRMLSELAFVDDIIHLVDTAIRWTSRQAGAWGMATVSAGLMDADVEEFGEIATPVQIATHEHNAWQRMPRSRLVVHRAPHTESVADLGCVDTVQRRLAVTHYVLADLFQWFGLVEAKQVTQEGFVRPSEFPGKSSDVSNWVDARHVPTAEPIV